MTSAVPAVKPQNRHRAREVALQILYRYDVALSSSPRTEPPRDGALAGELGQHFDHFAISSELREFAAELVTGTLRLQAEIDQLLERHAANWRLSRMSYVDRSLLRMAAYELKQMPDTPASVVIDEAIELGKQFGTSETPAFVNGILDAVKGELRAAQASG